jgi:hypothetical protein
MCEAAVEGMGATGAQGCTPVAPPGEETIRAQYLPHHYICFPVNAGPLAFLPLPSGGDFFYGKEFLLEVGTNRKGPGPTTWQAHSPLPWNSPRSD